ncbi:hypothetical protein MKZ38_006617 [Zalerion maritima]|uniref:NECAP PHear domain-containing protein n=1 Tax=Zalerion maritima TaxID=339359 RepID=A0AAD5WQ90_9PEZI|nr:hypothetical protein MKZ38_006617 [Zalerion maritima]
MPVVNLVRCRKVAGPVCWFLERNRHIPAGEWVSQQRQAEENPSIEIPCEITAPAQRQTVAGWGSNDPGVAVPHVAIAPHYNLPGLALLQLLHGAQSYHNCLSQHSTNLNLEPLLPNAHHPPASGRTPHPVSPQPPETSQLVLRPTSIYAAIMDPQTDPSTGLPLPQDAIQRIMFVNAGVHTYHIPPMSSLAGHKAADWTADPKRHIFTSRVRILETDLGGSGDDNSHLTTCIVLEDPSTGQLFAAAPYDDPSAVEPVTDSSRFFAVRVRSPEGSKKALLGLGFEERSDAFDFSVALEEARRVLGMEGPAAAGAAPTGKQLQLQKEEEEHLKRDLSLKDGETITINLGGKLGARKREPSVTSEQKPLEGASLNAFALAPPPGGGGASFGLPPPPKSTDMSAQKRLSRGVDRESAKALGFDDGQFGEFA